MIQKILITLTLLLGLGIAHAADSRGSLSIQEVAVHLNSPPPGVDGAYYDWGRGNDGTGYCYQFTWDGYVLNGGAAQPNFYCEEIRPSHSDWGRGNDGWGYCYQFTPYDIVMNQGAAISNWTCEQQSPTHYQWGRGSDGYTYCYQFTPYGLAVNQGQPVSNNYCY
jgi:hypothetical protein